MTTDTAINPDNYDTPWKEAIEHHFPEFMAFYFPDAHSQIDWQKGYTFLDQELQSVVQDGELGKRMFVYNYRIYDCHRRRLRI